MQNTILVQIIGNGKTITNYYEWDNAHIWRLSVLGIVRRYYSLHYNEIPPLRH